MAILKKKRNRLGAPPLKETTRDNLAEPEISVTKTKAVDGRTLRKTGRTQQFNTRFSKEFLAKLRKVAKDEGRTMAKIIELSLDSYMEKKDSS